MNRYPHAWPVEEFLKTNLKNKRAYARKRGYLRENTNQKQGQHDDDDAEEENDDDEEEDGGHDDEEEEDGGHDEEEGQGQKQEQKEEGWKRGLGWGVNSEDDMDGSEDDDVQD